MLEIGSVEIPILAGINPVEESEVDEIRGTYNERNVAVKHETEATTLIINGFLNEEMHSSSLSINEQKNELRSLQKNELVDNDINYNEWKGHLIIESIEFIDDSDSRIITEVTIDSKYHPWPKFCPENEP
jgi:hypothetical protein